jgi:hypothetical protein
MLSRSIPLMPSGSSNVAYNLAQQFTPESMVVMGAWYPYAPQPAWGAGWARRVFASLFPRLGTRGERHLMRVQFPLILARALWAVVFGRCRVVLAVYPDDVYALAGLLVSVITGAPLFAYFHNTLVEARPGDRFAAWLQARLFARARHVFVMSDAMARLYAERYPGLGCSPLVHGTNTPPPDDAVFAAVARVHAPLRLCLFGNLNGSNLDASRRMAQAVLGGFPGAQVSVFGGTHPDGIAAAGWVGAQVAHAVLAYDVLLNRVREHDILLLPHGFTGGLPADEIRTIFPTRTVDYLLSGRPVVAHMPADCAIADFLREHDCAVLVTTPDADAVRAAIAQVAGDPALRRRLVENGRRAAGRFHAPHVAAHLRDTIAAHLSPAERP